MIERVRGILELARVMFGGGGASDVGCRGLRVRAFVIVWHFSAFAGRLPPSAGAAVGTRR